MRQHKIGHTDDGWTHESIVEDGTFTSDDRSIIVGKGKVGIGLGKEWFSGTRIYKHSSYEITDPRQKAIAMTIIALIFLFVIGSFLYIALYRPSWS